MYIKQIKTTSVLSESVIKILNINQEQSRLSYVSVIRQWNTKNWRFEQWFDNTLKSNSIRCKKLTTIVSNIAVKFRHSCLPVFAWRRIVLRFFDPKQLLPVSCILWCYFLKCYQIMWVSIRLVSRMATFNKNIDMITVVINSQKFNVCEIRDMIICWWNECLISNFNYVSERFKCF